MNLLIQFPHISIGKTVRLYLVELRNERDRLVKRFKPFKELNLKTATYWHELVKKWISCLDLPKDIVSKFNIGRNYRVISILMTYDKKPFALRG